MDLPPVAFRVHIPVVSMCVIGVQPISHERVAAFPTGPPATRGIAIPLVVSANPDMIPAWTSSTMLPDTDWWAKLYDDLCMGRN